MLSTYTRVISTDSFKVTLVHEDNNNLRHKVVLATTRVLLIHPCSDKGNDLFQRFQKPLATGLFRLAIFLLKLASPHYGKICVSSGQWFWKNIFHTYHTSAFVKLFSCVSKHVTHLGSWFGKQFLTKLTIFLLTSSKSWRMRYFDKC